jgi:hypothetical protein
MLPVLIFEFFQGVAHVIMIGGAAPSLLRASHGLAPFILSLLLLAFGAGVFKPNIAPTIMDQYVHKREYTKVLPSGEKVLVDPEVNALIRFPALCVQDSNKYTRPPSTASCWYSMPWSMLVHSLVWRPRMLRRMCKLIVGPMRI